MSQDRSAPAPTLLFHAYRAFTSLIAPFAYRKVAAKLASHGISKPRQRERLGYASSPRPKLAKDAPFIWLHGASIGESLAAITLVNHLSVRLPEARFLLTSGTATSALMAQKRLPNCCQHQFAPLDAKAPVRRFLQHWQPTAGIFVESELWPVTLSAAKTRGTKLALVNARLSERSVARWHKKAATAQFILSLFDLLLTQNKTVAENLLALGACPDTVFPSGNLKAGAETLPVDDTAVSKLQQALGTRALWVASSTHQGEEEAVVASHSALLQDHPSLCLLLAPRHPERGDEIAALVRNAGLTLAQRSKNEPLQATTQVYLADTLGELGNWYALSPMVFLGGSLLPIGGHNPFEVAKAGAAVITGPGYSNFSETFPPMIKAEAAIEVADHQSLTAALDHWLTTPNALATAQTKATEFVAQQSGQLDAVIDRLITSLALETSHD